MLELGQLEKYHEDFTKRGVRIIAISNDKESDAKETQTKFPHVVIVSDPEQNVSKAMAVLHEKAAPDGGDTNAPTTFLVDGAGNVCWMFRSPRITDRLAPAQVLNAIDKTWPNLQ